jgi:hypothetical protein
MQCEGAAQNFFLTSRFHSAGAQIFFIWGCPVTARHAAGQGAMQYFFWSARAPEFFFCLSRVGMSGRLVTATLLCSARSFFECSVAVCRAVIFFCVTGRFCKSCVARAARKIFFLSLPRRSVRAAGRAEIIIFLSQPSKRVLSGRHADFCFYPQPRSNAGRAELFFRAAFSFAVWSHLRRNFFDLCGAWNLCSTLFQNPASEI